MPNYFVAGVLTCGEQVVVKGKDFHHITDVRREIAGNEIFLVDETGCRFSAVIDKINGDNLTCFLKEQIVGCEPNLVLTLYAAVLKGSSFDDVVRKATEVGVAKITPLLTERSVPNYGAKTGDKIARWRRIAEEAAKQSMRSFVPEIAATMSFPEVIAGARENCKLIAHLTSSSFNEFAAEIKPPADAALLIGPEGGFSPLEVKAAEEAGWQGVSFPFPQLRAER